MSRSARVLLVVGLAFLATLTTPSAASPTGEIDWLLGSQAELARVWRAWHIVPEREPNDPEVIEHSADIYGVGADGKVHVLYSPEFKPALLARDVQVLASS